MPHRPRRPVDAYSPPPKSAARRAAPYTPTPISKHSPRRYRSLAYDDDDADSDSEDAHSAVTASRGSTLTTPSTVAPSRMGRLNRLSRLLVHPWQTDHLPPVPRLPRHLLPPHSLKPSGPPTNAQQSSHSLLQKQQHNIVWTKGLNLLCSGLAGLCFIGAFCFDQYLTVDMAGFSSGDADTDRESIEVSFRDKSTFPPGSPVAGWARQQALYFYLCYGSLLAAGSCGVAVICVAQGRRLRDSLPSSLALALSGAADMDQPGPALHSEAYGTVYIKLWIFFILLAFPLVDFTFCFRAFASTQSFVSSVSQVGSASGVTMQRSSLMTVVGFMLMVLSWLLHMQEQRLRVHVCLLQHRFAQTNFTWRPLVEENSRGPAFPPNSASLRPLLDQEPSDWSQSPPQSDLAPTTVSPRTPAGSSQRSRHETRRPLRPASPTAFTEQLTESQFPLEAPPTAKRKAPRKREGQSPRHLKTSESGSASESAKNEVFADWGEPLQ